MKSQVLAPLVIVQLCAALQMSHPSIEKLQLQEQQEQQQGLGQQAGHSSNCRWCLLPGQTQEVRDQLGRQEIPLSHAWSFSRGDNEAASINLPHAAPLLPQKGVHPEDYCGISVYRKTVQVLGFAGNLSRAVFLDFDGAMMATVVRVNGEVVGRHKGGFVPFSLEISHLLSAGDNTLQLVVEVDATEDPSIPPFGGRVDYLTFSGLYRGVRLRLVNRLFLQDLFVSTPNATNSLRLEVTLKGLIPSQNKPALQLRLQQVSGDVLWSRDLLFPQGAGHSHSFNLTVPRSLQPKLQLWQLNSPTLYVLHVSLLQHNTTVDARHVTFGFRSAVWKANGFYLNGELTPLRGLNRHQTFPYIGAAAPARLQRRDAEVLKRELGINIVRASHYPQSPDFLERCDQIGLLVFEELPGWQHIGNETWQTAAMVDLAELILRDRNHPSIVVWGVRINESQDNKKFYTATNMLSHKLDPTRSTTGVRYDINSQMLEDVFSFNDFSNDVTAPIHTPWLITEFGGHMFPTKTWDNEERVVKHAMLHARVQSKQATTPNVSGAIGWCAFDYHTHYQFGSGDGICHHGVMDVFRLPKPAAWLYQSQQPPSVSVVLRAATRWTVGDIDVGGVPKLHVFSNVDTLQVSVGGRSLGNFTAASSEFPGLPFPPFLIDLQGLNAWGGDFSDLELMGYIAGRKAASQRVAAKKVAALAAAADDASLYADGVDMTRIALSMVDQHGNVLPYHTSVVVASLVEGEGEIVGDNPFPLVGQGALYYRSACCDAMQVKIRLTAARVKPITLTIQLE